MTIDKYYLTVCRKCFIIHGFVEERYNGKVPVLCYCELTDAKGGNISPSILCGYNRCGNGKVEMFWKPISDHKDSSGKMWHVPHFTGMGFGPGNPNHLQIKLDWVNTQNRL